MSSIGKILVVFGVILIIIGLVLWFGGQKLNWLGRLPGDIRIEKEYFSFYLPITTMLLLSALISIIIKLAQKIF